MAEERKPYNRRVHMANERTFLAWVRTSIGLMAFGFVVERFAIFVRQFTYFVQMQRGVPSPPGTGADALTPMHGYSSLVGVILIGLGAVMGVLSFVRYKTVEKQIEEGAYRPSIILDILLTLVILSIGMFLVIYMIHSL